MKILKRTKERAIIHLDGAGNILMLLSERKCFGGIDNILRIAKEKELIENKLTLRIK